MVTQENEYDALLAAKVIGSYHIQTACATNYGHLANRTSLNE